MLNYVIKRLLGLIPTLLIVAVLVFLFVHMLPGDPARLIASVPRSLSDLYLPLPPPADQRPSPSPAP